MAEEPLESLGFHEAAMNIEVAPQRPGGSKQKSVSPGVTFFFSNTIVASLSIFFVSITTNLTAV